MIQIVEHPIDRAEVIKSVASTRSGALVIFDGTVRSRARGRTVAHLHYQSYPSMAVRQMRKISEEVVSKWPIHRISIVHRTGRLEIGESSVLIAISAEHRDEAFEACRYAIDRLKTTVPIWKKEHYEDGSVWIEEYGGG